MYQRHTARPCTGVWKVYASCARGIPGTGLGWFVGQGSARKKLTWSFVHDRPLHACSTRPRFRRGRGRAERVEGVKWGGVWEYPVERGVGFSGL